MPPRPPRRRMPCPPCDPSPRRAPRARSRRLLSDVVQPGASRNGVLERGLGGRLPPPTARRRPQQSAIRKAAASPAAVATLNPLPPGAFLEFERASLFYPRPTPSRARGRPTGALPGYHRLPPDGGQPGGLPRSAAAPGSGHRPRLSRRRAPARTGFSSATPSLGGPATRWSGRASYRCAYRACGDLFPRRRARSPTRPCRRGVAGVCRTGSASPRSTSTAPRSN